MRKTTVLTKFLNKGKFIIMWSTSYNNNKWALCSWGHVTTIFIKIFYIMGYNLKNARNGKSISKIPKWQSLRSLALKKWDFTLVWILKKIRFVWK